MILHSQITPERSQITKCHPRFSPNYAFGTYFLILGLALHFLFTMPSPNMSRILHNPNLNPSSRISDPSIWLQIENLTFQIANLNCKCKSPYKEGYYSDAKSNQVHITNFDFSMDVTFTVVPNTTTSIPICCVPVFSE